VTCHECAPTPSTRHRPNRARARERPFRLCPRRSPIERLASGASSSRSGLSRIGLLGCGGDARSRGHGRVWPRGNGMPPSTARACAVSRPPHPTERAIRLRRNTAFAAWPRSVGADERPAARARSASASRSRATAALKARCSFFTAQSRDDCAYPCDLSSKSLFPVVPAISAVSAVSVVPAVPEPRRGGDSSALFWQRVMFARRGAVW